MDDDMLKKMAGVPTVQTTLSLIPHVGFKIMKIKK